eukprot:SAG11_NODE_12787_length_685_cov_1.245734_1_plen_102_part_10
MRSACSLALAAVLLAGVPAQPHSRAEGAPPPQSAYGDLKSHWKKAKEMGYAVVHTNKYLHNNSPEKKDCVYPKDGDTVQIRYTGRLKRSDAIFDKSPPDTPY